MHLNTKVSCFGRSEDFNLPLFLLRLLIESVHHVQQGIAGQDVGVGLGASLGIDDAGDIVELTKDVEAVEHQQQATFEEGTREASIPYKVGGVKP